MTSLTQGSQFVITRDINVRNTIIRGSVTRFIIGWIVACCDETLSI